MWTRLPLSHSSQTPPASSEWPRSLRSCLKWGRTVADDARRSNHGPRSSADTQRWLRPVFTYLWSPNTKAWRRCYAANRRKVNQSIRKGLTRGTRNGHSGRRRSHRDLTRPARVVRGHNKQEPPRTLEYAVEPRQSDIVIKVERIGDLLVDVLT